MVLGDQGGTFLDCTLGGAGHSQALLAANPNTRVVALDRDERAIARARKRLEPQRDRISFHHLPFSRAGELAGEGPFDAVIADLGLSTDQLKEGRGFSFADADSLDMRMDETQSMTAAELVNSVESRELYKILKVGGVGPDAKRFVSTIMRERPFENAKQLASAISSSASAHTRSKGAHPATVVFQALRIAVNREFEEIQALLDSAQSLVKPGGRLAVITFHSLEDKLVTHEMREWESGGSTYPANWPGAPRTQSRGRVLTRKPITASEKEVLSNPSARSARLRVFQFVH